MPTGPPERSVWATIKREMLEKGIFDTLEEARTELFGYIEVYYNRSRRHSALGYESPEEFEQMYYQNQLSNSQSKVSVK